MEVKCRFRKAYTVLKKVRLLTGHHEGLGTYMTSFKQNKDFFQKYFTTELGVACLGQLKNSYIRKQMFDL